MTADPLCHISPMGALHVTDLDLHLDPMQHLGTSSWTNSPCKASCGTNHYFTEKKPLFFILNDNKDKNS